MKQSAAVALALSACTAPRIDGSGARVEVGPPYAQRVSEIVREVEPKIIELLGTRWPWEYRVTLDREDEDSVAETREWDRRITLGPLSLSDEDMRLALAHELTHVHMRAPWTDLPRVLQEGVATWASLVVLDRTNEFGGPVPDWQLCIDVLTLSYSEFQIGRAHV